MLLKSLPQSKRAEVYFLLFCTMFCLALTLFRIGFTGSRMFFFLNWNLFLAFVPWATTLVVKYSPALQGRKRVLLPLLVLWLLFFPNSPYIFTDLLHLRVSSAMPQWFDMGLILCFSWTAMIFGFVSLFELEHLFRHVLKKKWIPVLSSAMLFLTAFGVYIGRFLRWNSWDIVSKPQHIAGDIFERIADPFAHPRTWGMTLLLGLFLNMIYWSLRILKKRWEKEQL